jgi:hypothetical protein
MGSGLTLEQSCPLVISILNQISDELEAHRQQWEHASSNQSNQSNPAHAHDHGECPHLLSLEPSNLPPFVKVLFLSQKTCTVLTSDENSKFTLFKGGYHGSVWCHPDFTFYIDRTAVCIDENCGFNQI